MGYYFTKEDTDNIKRAMSAADAAQIFCGSTIKGNSIICPSREHDDKNYGSCKVKDGKIHCYACQKTFHTCIDVVCDYFDADFHDSLILIAGKLGILEQFNPKDKVQQEKIQKIKERQWIRCLSEEEKRLLGLYVGNRSIGPKALKVNALRYPKSKCYYGWRADKSQCESTKAEGNGLAQDEEGYLVYERVTMNHTWLSFTDPLAYRTMILNKCYEKLSEIWEIWEQEHNFFERADNVSEERWHEKIMVSLEEEWLKVYELGKKYGIDEVEKVKKKRRKELQDIPVKTRTA